MKAMALEPLANISVQLLRKLYEKARFATTYALSAKQDELSAQLGTSRQAYNLHLRKLKNRGYIRTGRGFIDITEKGNKCTRHFIQSRFHPHQGSPPKRARVYDKIKEIGVWQAFRIAREVDSLTVAEKEQLD